MKRKSTKMKELLTVVTLLLSSVVAEPPAPYPASGWRPNGPSFDLPARVPAQNPQKQEYLPPVDPRRPVTPTELDTDDVSVQGLPTVEQQPIFQISPINGQQYAGPNYQADIRSLDQTLQQIQYQQQLEKQREFARQRQFEARGTGATGLPNPQPPRRFVPQTTPSTTTIAVTTQKPEFRTEASTEPELNEGEDYDDKNTDNAAQKPKVSVEVTKQNIQEYPPELFLTPLTQFKVQPQFVQLQQFGQLRAPLYYQNIQSENQRAEYDGPAHFSALPSVLAQQQLLSTQAQSVPQPQPFSQNPGLLIARDQQPFVPAQEPLTQYQPINNQYQPLVQPQAQVLPQYQPINNQYEPLVQPQAQVLPQYQPINNQYEPLVQPQAQVLPQYQPINNQYQPINNQYQPLVQPQAQVLPQYQPQVLPQQTNQLQPNSYSMPSQETEDVEDERAQQPEPQQPQQPQQPQFVYQPIQPQVYQQYQPTPASQYQPQEQNLFAPEPQLINYPAEAWNQYQRQLYQFPDAQAQVPQTQGQDSLQSGLDVNQQGNGIDQETEDDDKENEGSRATAVATAFGTRTQPRVFAQYGAPVSRPQANPGYTTTEAPQEQETEDGPAIAQATAVATGSRKSSKLRSRRIRPIFTLDRSGHLVLAQEQ